MTDYIALESTTYLWFASNNTSGSGDDGASAVFDVRLAGASSSAAPTLSGSATLLTHANYPPGCYEIAVAATTGNGFAVNNTYAVFCTLLVDSQNPTGFVGSFRTAPVRADVAAVNTTLLAAGALESLALDYDNQGYLAASVTRWLGTAVATPTTAGVPEVDVTYINAQPTSGWSAASVDGLEQLGQGYFDDGTINVNLFKVLGTILTEGASGRLAGGFVKWFNVASPTGTINSIPGAIPNANGGLPILSSSGTTLGYTVTTVSTVNALSTGSVTAAALATDAVGEIADGVWDEAIAGHLTAGSTGLALNSASSAGDPWGTALPGAYAAGTAGHILGMGIPDVAPGSANGLLRGGTNAATTFATLTVSGNVVVGGSVTVNSFNVTNDLNIAGELLANRLVLDEFYVDNTFTVVGAALMDNAGNDIKVNVKAVNDVALTGSGVIGDEWGPA